MKSDHSPECYKCADRMTDADIDEESPMGDALCIKCRKTREANIEEEAVASFCDGLREPVAEWFADIITKSGLTFLRRMPEDINDNCIYLTYHHACGLALRFDSVDHKAILSRLNRFSTTQPNWFAEFHCPMPERIVLAAIKAAVEHEAA